MSNNFPGVPGVPPTNNPTPPGFAGSTVSASAGIDFPPSPAASICGFSLGLPHFHFGFKLPSIAFPPALPIPFISFKLTCSLPNPIDVTAGLKLPYGGGRTYNAPPNPDDNDTSP
jgi:hypothetical protein